MEFKRYLTFRNLFIGFLLALMGGFKLASLYFKPILLILPKLSGGSKVIY